MNEEKNLMLVLKFIDSNWVKIIDDLDNDHLNLLRESLKKLVEKAKAATNNDALQEAAKEFFQVFHDIEPLKFLGGSMQPQLRSISLRDTKEEELNIKILNYCGILIEKIAKHEELKDVGE